MKKNIKLIISAVLVTVLSVQCNKKSSDPEPTPDPAPTTPGSSSITDVFTANGSPNQTFTVSATAPSTINANGVVIEIPSNAFETSTSGTVTGNVVVNVKTILTKSQVILSGAQANSSNAKLVSTKGCVKVTVSQNSQSLRLNSSGTNTVFVSVPDGPTMPPPTKKYYVTKLSVSDSTKYWQMENDTTDIPAVFDGTKYVHRAALDSLKWLNVGKQWDSTVTKTVVTATVNASTFNKNNTAVFISFNNSLTVGALYEVTPGVFKIKNMPVGKAVHIIGIALINGQYYKSVVSTTVSSTPVGLTFTPITQAQLVAAMALLP